MPHKLPLYERPQDMTAYPLRPLDHLVWRCEPVRQRYRDSPTSAARYRATAWPRLIVSAIPSIRFSSTK